ncbi:MAG TPA: right-handed parallel beta-helix repeat-containing protein, partial [Planctomycetota bacterium]|nr:right-handed parallel beta-helix repeat-containing protein [Planctomycetota bacterium]
RLSDPDGGAAERLLQARTIAEPSLPPGAPAFHVVPGEGGGSGSAGDPYKGLAAAEARAKPGDLLLIHAGAYPGTFVVQKSGQPGKPIVWRGAGDGEALVGGADAGSRGIQAEGVHDVWFERLTVRNKDYGIVAQESARMVIRRCHLQNVKNGIHNSRNTKGAVQGWWVSDNVLEGVSPWPRPGGKMDENEWRGIQLSGTGHEICYNRVHHFKDAIDTFPSIACAALDFHNNDVSELNDDGFEMDYSERNVRNYHNRIVNALCGVSIQPVYGGPAYIFRNVMYNITNEPFKMHNSPSGVLIFHNTSVRKGLALQLFTPEKVTNCVSRNNLLVGTDGAYAYQNEAPMIDCDFDYDGFAGGPWKVFLKWNGARYGTFEEMIAKAPVYRHAVQVDPATLFASGLRAPEDAGKAYDRTIDLRLNPGSSAIDAGEILPGWNDGFAGKAPDLGAYEFGQDPPRYGPRPEP